LATLSELTSAERVDAALAAPGLLVLEVYTQSCVICRRIEPMVAAVAVASGGAVRAHKLDAERHAEFAAKYNIRGVPTLLLCSVMDDRSAADRAFRRQALCAIGSARRCAMKHVDDRIMPAHRLVDAPKAPRPPGPFSHATVVGPWVYVSGMGGLDPRSRMT
jgi:thioredoxin 1